MCVVSKSILTRLNCTYNTQSVAIHSLLLIIMKHNSVVWNGPKLAWTANGTRWSFKTQRQMENTNSTVRLQFWFMFEDIRLETFFFILDTRIFIYEFWCAFTLVTWCVSCLQKCSGGARILHNPQWRSHLCKIGTHIFERTYLCLHFDKHDAAFLLLKGKSRSLTQILIIVVSML